MGTTLIKAKITDQSLEFTLKPMVASGGVNEDVIEFEFDELWDGFNTVAVFYRSKRDVFHIKIVGNRCTIPSEVLRTQGVCYVGVMGVKDNVTRTTNVLRYEIEHGAITAGVEPPEPTPSIYEQILETVKSTKQIAQSVRDDADAGMFDGAPGPKGDPGSDASVTAENIQSALGYAPVKDVQVAGASVLVNGVANVPVASDSVHGVVKTQSWGGTTIDNDGYLVISPSTNDHITRRVSKKAITPTNLDYAVKSAMCDGNGAAWTADEQKAARERMGIDKPYEIIKSVTTAEDVKQIVISLDNDGNAFALNCAIILVEYVGSENASIFSLCEGVKIGGGFNYCAYDFFRYTEQKKYSMFCCFTENGYWNALSYSPENQYNHRIIYGLSEDAFMKNSILVVPHITRIRIYADRGVGTLQIPTGTKIDVWGVRVNA